MRLRGALLALLAVAATPLHLYAANPVGIPRPERLLGLTIAVWLCAIAVLFFLQRAGVRQVVAENSVFVGTALLMVGGAVFGRFGPALMLLATLCSIAVSVLVFRAFADHWVVMGLITAVAVGLMVGPLFTYLESRSSQAGPSAVQPPGPLEIEMTKKPDIYVVVFDGYPGSLALAQDEIGDGEVDLHAELNSRGFQVPTSWTSYWTTTLAIPSLLEMGYPVTSGDPTSLESIDRLQKSIGGDNETRRVLEENGYRTHMVEAGWSGGSCGSGFDQCEPSPMLDDVMFLTTYRTAARPILGLSAGPFAVGTLAAFDWLIENGPSLSTNASPDFVFTHVVAPHAPYVLQGDCSRTGDERTVTAGFVDEESTVSSGEGLEAQMDCVESLMVDFVDRLQEDDVVVLVSDHGSASRGQLDESNAPWTQEAIVERMNNLVAARLPDSCRVADPVMLPNVMRHVFSCFSSQELAPLPERMWVNPMVEIESDVLASLLGMAP